MRKYVKWTEEEQAAVQKCMRELWSGYVPSTAHFVSMYWEAMQQELPKNRRRTFCSKKEIETLAALLEDSPQRQAKRGRTSMEGRVDSKYKLEDVERWKAYFDEAEAQKREHRQVRKRQLIEQARTVVVQPLARHKVLVGGVHEKDRQVLEVAVRKKYPDVKLSWLDTSLGIDIGKRVSGHPCIVSMHGSSPYVAKVLQEHSSRLIRVNGIAGVLEAVNTLKASNFK